MNSSEAKLIYANNGQAERGYKGIPAFVDWQKASVDVEGWNQAMAGLNELGEVSVDLLRRMRIIIKRAANSIKGRDNSRAPLDDAVQSAMWLAAMNEKGEDAQPAIQSQLLAYDHVINAAVKNSEVSQDWIRELHARICRTQKTYEVATANGVKEETLRLGEYKRVPNHVPSSIERGPIYAPVCLAQAEMNRLCEELNGNTFRAAHPVHQASYALYSFLLIHPFADGNGRVARSLALLFTYRSNSIPMLALTQKRSVYVSSLIGASRGDVQPLIDFVGERAIDAIRLMEGRIRASLC